MKSLTINASKHKVFEALQKASSNLDWEIESSDLSKGKLKLFHRGGILSFGNEISVKVTTRNSRSVIRVSSKSAASIQVIDWGTNDRIEKDLVDEVKHILNR